MKKLFGCLIGASFILCIALDPAVAQTPPNTITFDNQSGEIAMVKLVGPSKVAVDVPNGEKRTVNVEAGDYYLLGRYGIGPEKYKYTKGDPFEVTQSGRQYSVITITLHKVVDGNYNTEPVSGKEFEGLENTGASFKGLATSRSELKKPNHLRVGNKIQDRNQAIFVEIENLSDFPIPVIKDRIKKYASQIFTESGAGYLTQTKQEANLLLIVEFNGKASGEMYNQYFGDIKNLDPFFSYEGAEVEGSLWLKDGDNVSNKEYFKGEISAPDELEGVGGKQPSSAPFGEAFDRSNYREKLWELIGFEWGVMPLLHALGNSDYAIYREQALLALKKMRVDWTKTLNPNDKAMQFLVRWAIYYKDEDAEVVKTAIQVLKTVKASKPIIPLLKDKDEFHQKRAVYTLGEIGGDSALDALHSTFGSQNQTLKLEVVIALGKIRNQKSVTFLLNELSSSYDRIREESALALGKIGDTRAKEPLRNLAKIDEKERVRTAAKTALKNF